MNKYTVQETAERLGISVDAVRKRINRGALKSSKENGRIYILIDELPMLEPVESDNYYKTELDYCRNRIRDLEQQLFTFMQMSLGKQITKPKKSKKKKKKKK